MSVFSSVTRVLRRHIQVKRRAAELIKKYKNQAYEAAVRETANDWPSGRGDFYRAVSKEILRRNRDVKDASASLTSAKIAPPTDGDAGRA